jgi:hypothetical protein
MIHRHPHVITATEIQIKGSTGIVDSVMRFRSLSEVVDHFTSLGVPVDALEAARQSLETIGMATLEFSATHKA